LYNAPTELTISPYAHPNSSMFCLDSCRAHCD
jgi:hypothetical protein